MSRTIVLVSWLLAVLWHGVRGLAEYVVLVALLAVWAAAFVRDGRPAPAR